MKYFRICCVPLQAVILLLSITFFVLSFYAPTMITDIIWEKIYESKHLGLVGEVEKDSNGRIISSSYNELLRKFINPPYSMQLQIWVFNVTNPTELMNNEENGAKPKLKELGPYTFKEVHHKEAELTDNGTLRYRTFRTFFYDPEKSCKDCSLDDEVVVASVAFQGLVKELSKSGGFFGAEGVFKRFGVEYLLTDMNETTSVFRRQFVRELLFEGYKDEVIDKLCSRAGCPEDRPERIGLFYKKNGSSDDGWYEVDTGAKNVMDLGRLRSWNNMKVLGDGYWYADGARWITNGTDSQLYPPRKLLERKNLVMFVGQACRLIELEFKEMSIVHGLPMQRYVPAKSMANVTLEDKKGFCVSGNSFHFGKYTGNCAPPGLMQMEGCNSKALHVFVSNAHFYDAAPELREGLEGMAEPNADDDITFVDIEPYTGVVVQAQRRSQISLGLWKGSLHTTDDMVESMIVPIIWLNNSVIFDGETRDRMAEMIFFFWLASISWPILCIIGLSFLSLFFVFLVGCIVHINNDARRALLAPPRVAPMASLAAISTATPSRKARVVQPSADRKSEGPSPIALSWTPGPAGGHPSPLSVDTLPCTV